MRSAEKNNIYIYTFFFALVAEHYEKIHAKAFTRENIQQLKCLGKRETSILNKHNELYVLFICVYIVP